MIKMIDRRKMKRREKVDEERRMLGDRGEQEPTLAASASATPSTRGCSGPTTTSAIEWDSTKDTIAGISDSARLGTFVITGPSTSLALAAVPPLPGATKI